MKKLLLIIALCSCLACGSLGIVKDKDASHTPTRTPAMALAAAEGSFSPKELSEATRPAPVFTAAPTDTPVPTATPTWTPVPTATPTPIPIPVPMTISEVETAIAQGDFECIGTRVQFCGTVFHTLSDGDPVIPEGANFSVVVILRGLAETIPESTGVSGTGTISVCDTWSRITLELSQVVLD